MRAVKHAFASWRTKLGEIYWRGREVVIGRPKLRRCDVVGRWSRVRSGRLVVENHGRIEIGERTRFTCGYGPSELRTAPGALLTIGSRTAVNFATLIDAHERISIGDDVSIGPYCVIADSDAASVPGAVTAPISIGNGAWLASRVTLLPGAVIGAGAVITAGSIVGDTVPPGVVAGGIPARVLRGLAPDEDIDAVAPAVEPLAPPATSPTGPTEAVASGVLISDFTIDPLVAALRDADPPLAAHVAPFGAVVQTLLDPPDTGRDFAVVWTRPEQLLASVGAALDARPVDLEELHAEVDRFAAQVTSGLAGFRCVLVPTWTMPTWNRGRGLTDLRPGGLAWAVANANARLMESLATSTHVLVVDAQRWLATVGERAYSERLHYLAKIPFDDRVFAEAAADIAAAWRSVSGAARKLVVLDLDNTLWGGVVGDDGWEGLRLGGHDAVGEAFVDFQRGLKSLQRRGVLLGIASKNEEHVALEAIDRHASMVLRRDDFVGWRIDWNDKGANIAALAADLNLGLQSVVFIDDNPHERARIRDALPEVLVPDWPEDPAEFVKALASLRCFDTAAVTAEDRDRTAMYAAEQQRAAMRTEVGSLDDWLQDLGIVVRVEPLGPANLPRATQLLNKTNQMNLRTRRMTSSELATWPEPGRRTTWCVSVSDRLGDAGLTGIVSVEADGQEAELVDFVLSCRVMGRRVEDTMLHLACLQAAQLGAGRLTATLVPTEKNAPCARFFEAGPLVRQPDGSYVVDLTAPAALPAAISLELVESAGGQPG
jgi:FkbH-like protein